MNLSYLHCVPVLFSPNARIRSGTVRGFGGGSLADGVSGPSG
jgi:hypothetical protein